MGSGVAARARVSESSARVAARALLRDCRPSNKYATLLCRLRHDEVFDQSDQNVAEIVRRSDRARVRIISADIEADADGVNADIS